MSSCHVNYLYIWQLTKIIWYWSNIISIRIDPGETANAKIVWDFYWEISRQNVRLLVIRLIQLDGSDMCILAEMQLLHPHKPRHVDQAQWEGL